MSSVLLKLIHGRWFANLFLKMEMITTCSSISLISRSNQKVPPKFLLFKISALMIPVVSPPHLQIIDPCVYIVAPMISFGYSSHLMTAHDLILFTIGSLCMGLKTFTLHAVASSVLCPVSHQVT